MTARERVSGWLGIVVTLVFLPARLAEELIHATVAIPFSEWVFIRFNPRGCVVETVVQWREETPKWVVTAGAVAPEAVAALTGVAVLAWWVVGPGSWSPNSSIDWYILIFLGCQYALVAAPEFGEQGNVDRAQLDTGTERYVPVIVIGLFVAVLVGDAVAEALPAAPPRQLVGPPGVVVPPAIDVSGVAFAGVTAALLAVGVAWSVWEVRRHDAG